MKRKYNYGELKAIHAKSIDNRKNTHPQSASQINVVSYHHETKKKAEEFRNRVTHSGMYKAVPSPAHLTSGRIPNPKRSDGKYHTVDVATNMTLKSKYQ
jgi:hypothetical protein